MTDVKTNYNNDLNHTCLDSERRFTIKSIIYSLYKHTGVGSPQLPSDRLTERGWHIAPKASYPPPSMVEECLALFHSKKVLGLIPGQDRTCMPRFSYH